MFQIQIQINKEREIVLPAGLKGAGCVMLVADPVPSDGNKATWTCPGLGCTIKPTTPGKLFGHLYYHKDHVEEGAAAILFSVAQINTDGSGKRYAYVSNMYGKLDGPRKLTPLTPSLMSDDYPSFEVRVMPGLAREATAAEDMVAGERKRKKASIYEPEPIFHNPAAARGGARAPPRKLDAEMRREIAAGKKFRAEQEAWNAQQQIKNEAMGNAVSVIGSEVDRMKIALGMA